jgi:pantothenate synthetase
MRDQLAYNRPFPFIPVQSKELSMKMNKKKRKEEKCFTLSYIPHAGVFHKGHVLVLLRAVH